MSANFAPDLNYGASGIGDFRFWVRHTEGWKESVQVR